MNIGLVGCFGSPAEHHPKESNYASRQAEVICVHSPVPKPAS